MSGDWPPEWDDPDDEFPDGDDQLDPEVGARLSEVTAYLASVPAPVLPDAVEARISAVLAAEAAARQAERASPAGDDGPGAAAPAGEARPLRSAPLRARVRRRRNGGSGPRALRSRPLTAVGSVIVCLILAGLGYTLSRGSSSPATSSASSASGTAGQSYAAAVPGPASSASSASSASAAAGSTAITFAVTASGTRYQAATLAAQARGQLAAYSLGVATAPRPSSQGSAPAATPTTPATAPGSKVSVSVSPPSAALRGCVARLTGGLSPRLVDQATYQGEPAYIIISSAKVWVVGLGCTADNPELIASVPLGA